MDDYDKLLIKQKNNITEVVPQNFATQDFKGLNIRSFESFKKVLDDEIVISENSPMTTDGVGNEFYTETVNHNLEYAPIALCYFKLNGDKFFQPMPAQDLSYGLGGYNGFYGVHYAVTDKQVSLHLMIDGAGTVFFSAILPITIRYILFEQPITSS